MNQESKSCENCKSQFTIAPEDFDYYAKISVPPPTWCPDCRLDRRMIWRNERTLYKRKCNAPEHTEDIISIYAPEKPYVVYDHDFYFSDAWDPIAYGKDYDFNKPFFTQFDELLKRTPVIALFDAKSVNSSYCNLTVEHKNCYLVSGGWGNEDSLYSNRISYCRETVDSYVCHKTESSYENVQCKDSYQLFFSKDSENCRNSYFLYDCRNCSDCIGCTNLRNKQYYILNQPYTKEEYLKKVAELNLGNVKTIDDLKNKFQELELKAIHRYAHLLNTSNVIGDHVEKAKNCYYCFDLAGEAENVKYSHWGTYGLKDFYDTGPGTGGNSELVYEGISIGATNARCYFGAVVWYSHDVLYSFNCQDSSNLFGCVGLRKKEYCILNKQYTKEEYHALLPRIIEQMNAMPYVDQKGRAYKFGELFPPEISPFAYNETVAQDYHPISEEEAEKKGYAWRVGDKKQPQVSIMANELPEEISKVTDEILNQVIGCVHEGKCADQCALAFRIVPQELQFYRKLNLPLPRLCPNCRHYARVKQKNPLKLWHARCRCAGKTSENGTHENTAAHAHGAESCPHEFETSYAPERVESIYCEECYNSEIV